MGRQGKPARHLIRSHLNERLIVKYRNSGAFEVKTVKTLTIPKNISSLHGSRLPSLMSRGSSSAGFGAAFFWLWFYSLQARGILSLGTGTGILARVTALRAKGDVRRELKSKNMPKIKGGQVGHVSKAGSAESRRFNSGTESAFWLFLTVERFDVVVHGVIISFCIKIKHYLV
jgi:hypothetical protein